MGKVLVEILEKVSWVVLECDYDITPKSNEQNYFYHLDNHKHPSKSHYGIKSVDIIVNYYIG